MKEEEKNPYEILREENIARNKAQMKLLGLNTEAKKPKTEKKRFRAKANPERQRQRVSNVVKRTSSRVKRAVHYYGMNDGEDSNSDFAPGDDDTADDDEYEDAPSPKRRKARIRVPLSVQPGLPSKQDDDYSLLVVELAKTGRSKCRACLKPIEKGIWRVGMHAWIMGRNSLTWQCPGCFIDNMVVALEKSGRGKCKLTHQAFEKGTPKLGVRSHTATSWVSIACIPRLLAPVYRAAAVVGGAEQQISADKGGDEDQIEGLQQLSAKQRQAVLQGLREASTLCTGDCMAGEGGKTRQEARQQAFKSAPSPAEAGRAATSSGPLTGKVAWRWGGHVCYGTLKPRQETSTHCYARTQRGKTKTLAKGKDYWWLLDADLP